MRINNESGAIMAGERLYRFIAGQHTPSSERADIAYGVVTSINPLRVQLANNLVLDDNFLVLGKHIGKFKVQGKAMMKGNAEMTFHNHHDTANISKANLNFPKKEMYLEIDNSLEKNDKVAMLRMDGGQQYYIFERLGEDGYGF